MENQGSDFEATFLALQSTVERLEQGELSLEETLELYEKAVNLAKLANQILDKAELRIKVLNQKPGGTYSLDDLDWKGVKSGG